MAITLEQAKALKPGDMLYSTTTFNRKGEPARARITGKVQTWKRDPSRVRVPWKVGLYQYGAVTESDLDFWCMTEEEAKDTRGTLRIESWDALDMRTGMRIRHTRITPIDDPAPRPTLSEITGIDL